MASFEIILGATPRDSGATASHLEPTDGDLLDVVVDGERFSAASRPEQAACLLRDLVSAGTSVLEGRTTKALVPLCDAPWELCLVGGGDTVRISLYRTGPLPEVRVLDRAVPAIEMARQSRAALEGLRARMSDSFARELEALVMRFELAANAPAAPIARMPDTLVRWRTKGEDRPLRLAFETVISGAGSPDGASVRADLHALLFRGRLSFQIRGQRGALAPGFVFLQIERLVSLCRPLLEAFTARRALHLRVAAGSSMLGLRLGVDGQLSLSIAQAGTATFTAPALDPKEFALPVADAALALAQGVIRCDRSRAKNLRLRVLRSEARAVRRLLHDLGRGEGKLNHDPEPYRASTVPASLRDAAPQRAGLDLTTSARLRYSQRWRAEIEGIDLRGTLLCGDRLVVPGAREICALDRKSGHVIWSKTLPRAATTLAGGNILRLSSRGECELRDVADGELLWASRLAPRVGAPALAFSVNTIGIPKLVLLAEGERRLVALDLRTGEPRWRYTARTNGTFRIRRVGRLIIVVSGDPSVTALDAATGEVVWRVVGNAPFNLTPSIHREVVIASSGTPGRGASCIYAIDAFTGALRWSHEDSEAAASVPIGAANVAVIALAGREGVQVVGRDLGTGAETFRLPLGCPSMHGATLALSGFDDLLVANLPNGRVAAVDAGAGEIRWSRILAAPVADDTPRRLDVQLRAGALFVPQSSLAVLRPRDGALMANVDACDLVPDLVRVDEQCALYVAEESGHIGCYELGARLSVVPMMN